MARILGIDLGTTNLRTAVWADGMVRLLPGPDGSPATPACVGFARDDLLCGAVALRQAVTNPLHTVSAAKRLLGRRHDDPAVRRFAGLLSYRLGQAENGDVRILAGDQVLSPEEVVAYSLCEVVSAACETLDEEVSSAILTVPACFDETACQAARNAGRIAGLEVHLLAEPLAAVVAWSYNRGGEPATVMVYDLGGGTFDAAVVLAGKDRVELLGAAGDSALGGEDFDQRIMSSLLDEIRRENGIDLSGDTLALQRLKAAAESARIELSLAAEATIDLPLPAAGASGPFQLSYTLERGRFELQVKDLVRRAEELACEALAAAELAPGEVDEILLLGGTSRSPSVVESVRKIFGRRPSVVPSHDQVAVGAALRGAVLGRELIGVAVPELSLPPADGSPERGLMAAEVDALESRMQERTREDPKRRGIRRIQKRLKGLIYSNERIFEQLADTLGGSTKQSAEASLLRAQKALGAGTTAEMEESIADLGGLSEKLDQAQRTREALPEYNILQSWETRRLRKFLRDLLPVAEGLFARFRESVDVFTREWIERALAAARQALDSIDRSTILAAVLELLAVLREIDPDDPAAVAVLRWFLEEEEATG